MTKLQALQLRALTACRARGHVMGTYAVDVPKIRSTARCNLCDSWVQVDVRPAPNSVEVGGPAVAVQCSGGVPRR